MENYVLEDFVQMRTMNREMNEYKTENDLIMHAEHKHKSSTIHKLIGQ